MSKTLRRPMFRMGGAVNSRGTGITSGLDRPGYSSGGTTDIMDLYNKFSQRVPEVSKPKLNLGDYLRIASAGAEILGAPGRGGGIKGALVSAGQPLAKLGSDLGTSIQARQLRKESDRDSLIRTLTSGQVNLEEAQANREAKTALQELIGKQALDQIGLTGSIKTDQLLLQGEIDKNNKLILQKLIGEQAVEQIEAQLEANKVIQNIVGEQKLEQIETSGQLDKELREMINKNNLNLALFDKSKAIAIERMRNENNIKLAEMDQSKVVQQVNEYKKQYEGRLETLNKEIESLKKATPNENLTQESIDQALKIKENELADLNNEIQIGVNKILVPGKTKQDYVVSTYQSLVESYKNALPGERPSDEELLQQAENIVNKAYSFSKGGLAFAEGGQVSMDDIEQKRIDLEPANKSVDMPYEEFRDKMDAQVSDDIVQLIYYNPAAFSDFANIETQDDVYDFNKKYDVNLVLPFQTQST